jgi:O-antigen ligase
MKVVSSDAAPGALREKTPRPVATTRNFVPFILFIALHLPLAFAMEEIETVATVHALTVVLFGLWWASQRAVERVAWVGAYVVGAEVLWRMTDAAVFHEFGKYALSLIFIATLLATRRLRPPMLALTYFLLLVPAAWVTAFAYAPADAREMISANMSGPFALLLSIWLFRRGLVIDRNVLVRVALVLVAPIVAIATVAASSTMSADQLTFTTASNFATSGGFGPNQVSAMLGLGMIACALAFGGAGRLLRGVLLTAFTFLLVQCALTFSRTGLALLIIGLVAYVPFELKSGRQRWAILGLLALVFAFVQFWMIPALNDFTSGMFAVRYTDANLSNRAQIMMADIGIWMDNPFLGIGAGAANEARANYGFIVSAAHTEYTRMVAEHGLLGLLALLVLLSLGAIPIFRRQRGVSRGVRLALVFWAFAFMVVSAFRLAAPAFLLGLCWAPLVLDARRRPALRV